MKKSIGIIVLFSIGITMLAGCSMQNKSENNNDTPHNTTAGNSNDTENTMVNNNTTTNTTIGNHDNKTVDLNEKQKTSLLLIHGLLSWIPLHIRVSKVGHHLTFLFL